MNKKTLSVLALIFIGAMSGGIYFYTKNEAETAKGGAIPVEAIKIESRPLVSTIETVGNLKSNEGAIIRAEVQGRVVEVNFQEGTEVSARAVLVRLDDSTYRAELKQAEARYKLASETLTRAEELQKTGAGTTKNLDEAKANFNESEAAVALAKARFEKTEIRAPFNGILGLRKISVGDFLNVWQEIVNIEDISVLKLDFSIPEKYLLNLSVGQEVKIKVDAYSDKEFYGQVYAIDPRIDPISHNVEVRAKIPNNERLLRPGLFARVTLVVEKKEKAILIPEEAIVPFSGQNSVYLIYDGKAKLVPVKTGLRQNNNVEIVEGVKEGDAVVTAGHIKIRDGMGVVNILDTPPVGAENTGKK